MTTTKHGRDYLRKRPERKRKWEAEQAAGQAKLAEYLDRRARAFSALRGLGLALAFLAIAVFLAIGVVFSLSNPLALGLGAVALYGVGQLLGKEIRRFRELNAAIRAKLDRHGWAGIVPRVDILPMISKKRGRPGWLDNISDEEPKGKES